MTELIWDGKYKDGKKVSPVLIALPFQTIETVNEKRKAGLQTDMFAQAATEQAQESGWKNRLIWGDKKYVLPSLLPELAGKVNLIYIDPPFDTGANFSFTATIPQHDEDDDGAGISFTKQPSVIEQKAYRDTWGRGLDSYLQWFYETAILLRELLADDGSIYVHLDWHVGHYAKTVLDEVFGYENFKNEIIWKRSNAHSDNSTYGNVHDVLLFYVKSDQWTWNQQFIPYSEEYVQKQYRYVDENGRRFLSRDLSASGLSGGGYEYEWKGVKRVWRCPPTTMERYEKEGRLTYTGKGLVRYKQFLEEMPGLPIQSVWDDVSRIHHLAHERIDYPTQKPEALLERIIKASSNEGDLVLDCFCGSGTTAAVAEKLGRRWITCDLGRFAIHTARKRLLGNPKVQPFEVQNLGKYERQQWMLAEFNSGASVGATSSHADTSSPASRRVELEQQYRKFILDLYHANPLAGYAWLHGARAGRLVHVGSVDAPVSPGDVKALVLEFWKVAGKEKDLKTNGIDILAWDFAFELNEMAAQFAAENKVELKFKKIPREVLEKKAVEQGDIRFFELASLGVSAVVSKRQQRELTLSLENFIVPPDEVPEEVQGKISHWSQWIDYWAVDWNYRDDTFHNEWQSYRTKQEPKLELSVAHQYEAAGKYQVVVKVIDILGNDTTKLITVEI